MAALSVRGLHHRLGANTLIALDALDLAPGRLVTLSGPSGSGKSTLLYLLSGLLVPAGGAVVWDGTDLAGLGEGARDRWRLRYAGFVFQNFHLIEELSPLDNVLVPVWFTAFRTHHWRDRARALLARFGVPEGRRHAGLLSRGEQQRVALARALIFDPPVIFADEPTASLDAIAGTAVARVLATLAREENRLVIAASHDAALHGLADRRIALDHGRAEERLPA